MASIRCVNYGYIVAMAIISWQVRAEICTDDVCKFTLEVAYDVTMTWHSPDGRESFNVEMDGTDLVVIGNRFVRDSPFIGQVIPVSEAITADGVPRPIIKINGQFPGPTLEVLENTQVEVTVINSFETASTSVHWHGMRQMGTSHMDGIPYVNQCPLLPGQNLTYMFKAAPHGTHWYHSHLMHQRLDGFYGMLIVHKVLPSIPEFTMIMQDIDHGGSTWLGVDNPWNYRNPGPGDFVIARLVANNVIMYGDGEVAGETGSTENGRNEGSNEPGGNGGNDGGSESADDATIDEGGTGDSQDGGGQEGEQDNTDSSPAEGGQEGGQENTGAGQTESGQAGAEESNDGQDGDGPEGEQDNTDGSLTEGGQEGGQENTGGSQTDSGQAGAQENNDGTQGEAGQDGTQDTDGDQGSGNIEGEIQGNQGDTDANPDNAQGNTDDNPGDADAGDAQDDTLPGGTNGDQPEDGDTTASHGSGVRNRRKRQIAASANEFTYIYSDSLLVNGRGRFIADPTPLTRYHVSKGGIYRFRMSHAGVGNGIRVHIHHHKLRVVAVDGCDIDRVDVDTIYINPGERLDFELVANQEVGRYWISTKLHFAWNTEEDTGDNAVLSYYSADEDPVDDPETDPIHCTADNPCTSFNCKVGYGEVSYTTCISMADVRALTAQPEFYLTAPDEDVFEVFLNFGFMVGPNINGIKNVVPWAYDRGNGLSYVPCETEDCLEGCECTRFIELPWNKTIQLVVSNYDQKEEASALGHHTLHVHGHNFAVVAMGYPVTITPASPNDQSAGGQFTSNNDIDCGDQYCQFPKWRFPASLNLDKPAIKDTVIVPSMGYTVVRFRTDNPGIWQLHCHVDAHAGNGMGALIIESSPSEPWSTNDLPSCAYPYPPVLGPAASQTNSDNVGADTDGQNGPTYGGQGETTQSLTISELVGIVIGSALVGAILTLLAIALVRNCGTRFSPASSAADITGRDNKEYYT